MYSVVFERENGQKYLFGADGNTVFDMDFGNGVSVNVGTSQGFSQVGETVESMTVGGRPISVKGAVFGDVHGKKTAMRRIFAPFTWGRLIFDGKYYTRVCVKESPTFSPVKNDGRFTMQFFAPFPFFYFFDQKNVSVGGIDPMFRFPVNYSIPHKFGFRSANRYSNIYNDGDVDVPYRLYIESIGESVNPSITNVNTLEQFKINGTLSVGDVISVYRDENNVLRAELTSNGKTTDVLSWIDDSSNLFVLHAGDNLITYNDDLGGNSLTIRLSYSPAVVAVYES